ncbi:MAG: glycoside hydrolase family 16 protein [Lentisphaeria bacterium]|nr:glycoside hydrolase family 16 protein [Lentisphaeria bacterium]
MKQFDFQGHAPSYLPEDKNWRLVWHDEFDGTELDRSKWGFRLNFWGKRLQTFTEEGVEFDNQSHMRLHLIRKDGHYYSPHLQTGSLTYDIPRDSNGFWPFGKQEQPRFMHKFGYYEIRCRLPKNPGWHAAFWLQACGIGSHPDPRQAGVECDIMENYRQHTEGKLIGGNLWGGYGKDGAGSGHFSWDFKETDDCWHYFGVDWSSAGYRFYADGNLVGTVLPPEMAHLRKVEKEGNGDSPWSKEGSVTIGPVSQVEQFILVSTECHGYRENGMPDPLLEQAVLPDYFEVDHVRVFDAVNPTEC